MTAAPGCRFRLLALDLDGTLLDPASSLRPATHQAVREATEAGVEVVLASGRSPRHMRAIHDDLGLHSPVVAQNGAVVVDLASGAVLHHEPISLEIARHVLEIIQRYHPEVNLHVETHHGPSDAWHVDQLDERVRLFVERYRVLPPDSVGAVQQLLRDEAVLVSKLWFSAPAETMVRIKEQFMQELAAQIDTLAFDNVSLTVLSTGVSKASAIAWLADRHALGREQVMAIGDEVNDIPLLGWVGLGVAMGNAIPAVKSMAAFVTGSNAEDGAAAAIRRFILSASA